MDHICSQKFGFGGNHLYESQCPRNTVKNGYMSHIRGSGSNLYHNSKVFPGNYPLGNESGINGPLYVANPDIGPLITIKREHDGTPGYHRIYFRDQM